METRTALLDSAERAARRYGYDGFSYADLARDVGIRKASIHHHFPTKAGLSAALLERYCARFEETLTRIRARQVTAAVQLRAYVAAYRAALSGGDALCLCVSFSAGPGSLPPPALAEMARFHRKNLDWLEALFTSGRDDGSIVNVANPAEDAAATLALVKGAQLMARAARRPDRYDQATAALLTRCR